MNIGTILIIFEYLFMYKLEKLISQRLNPAEALNSDENINSNQQQQQHTSLDQILEVNELGSPFFDQSIQPLTHVFRVPYLRLCVGLPPQTAVQSVIL